jgi:hypothetical protein
MLRLNLFTNPWKTPMVLRSIEKRTGTPVLSITPPPVQEFGDQPRQAL